MNLKKATTAEMKAELDLRAGRLYIETLEVLTGKTHHLSDGRTDKALCGKEFADVEVWTSWEFEEAQGYNLDDLIRPCTEGRPLCRLCARKFEKMKAAALACST